MTIFDKIRCQNVKISGIRFDNGNTMVFVNKQALSMEHSRSIIDHSPDGFEWGYNGSGPAQLALSILLLFTDRDTAVRLYQQFKSEIIATCNNNITDDQDFFHMHINLYQWLMDHKI